MSRILLIDDDKAICRTLEMHFGAQGHEVRAAHDLEAGVVLLGQWRPQLLVLDVRLPGKSGLEGLPEVKRLAPGVPVLVVTAFHDMATTVATMSGGADDYITKPIDVDELDSIVARLLARPEGKAWHAERGAAEARAGDRVLVGRSRAMREVFKTIGRVARTDTTVLISGESGTGKELVARAIHHAAKGPTAPFVAVSCAALVETLIESDLFGHERGAFTGAVNRQVGKFALADQGTLFLDEVGELSAGVQAKLLRVLQEREYSPIGSRELHHTSARVIAATNVDLAKAVERGRFREDLYYRLTVVSIRLPALRERIEDFDDLVPALLARIHDRIHRGAKGVARDVMDAFRAYHWPGNVRELENALTKAAVMCPRDTLSMEYVQDIVRGSPQAPPPSNRPPAQRSLREVEREHVARVLSATGWHRSRACEILGVSRPRLRRLIREYALVPPNIARGAAPKGPILPEP